MASKSFNRVHMTTNTVGTGALTLIGAAAANVLTFAQAGAVNGDEVNYVLEDGADFEVGSGVIGGGGTTLTRATVFRSKAGATVGIGKLNLSGTGRVRSVEPAELFNSAYMRAGSASIDDLADVDLTTTPPSNGDGFVWDDALEKWVPGPAGGGMFKGNNGTVGSRSGDIFRVNANLLTEDVTITAGTNASATGPLEIDTGNVIEIETGASLVIL